MWYVVIFHTWEGGSGDLQIVYAVDSAMAVNIACKEASCTHTCVSSVLCAGHTEPTIMLDWLLEEVE